MIIYGLLSLLVGLFLGSLITRQYDKYKERENDVHTLLLAIREIDNFEGELIFWDGGLPFSDDEIKKQSLLKYNSINEFLNSKLSAILPIEVREDFKQIVGWIISLNLLYTQISNNKDYDKKIFDEIRSKTMAQEEYISELLVRIMNSLKYSKSVKHLCFGIKPNDFDILKCRTDSEIAQMKIKFNI